MQKLRVDTETVGEEMQASETSCTTLLHMAAVAGFWSDEERLSDWERVLERFCPTSLLSGSTVWIEMRSYPATLCLYALGMGAAEAGKLDALRRLFSIPVRDEARGENTNLLSKLVSERGAVSRYLTDLRGSRHPLSDRLHGVLRDPLRNVIPDDIRYSLIFDKFEILSALAFSRMGQLRQMPHGAFLYRRDNRLRIIEELEESVTSLGNLSPVVTSGIIGDTTSECVSSIEDFGRQSAELADRFRF